MCHDWLNVSGHSLLISVTTEGFRMMFKTPRKLVRFLLIPIIILVLYRAFRWGFDTEARYDRVGKASLSGNVNYGGITH